MPFASLGLADPLVRAVSDYPAPTQVQTAAIPVILQGRDLLATAQTGSGKTTAFVLPLLQRWLAAKHESPRPLHTLILVPTRELATQVREAVQQCSLHLPERTKIVSAVGGISINPQMMALRGGTDFLVATPGRLLDLVERNAVKLSSLGTLVLDEADRMLDLGFAEELDRLLALLPAQRQTLLFSATFPKKVEAIAQRILRDPTRIEIISEPIDAPDIQQRAIRVDTDQRTPLLRHLITTHGWKRVLVFVSSQYTADHVAEKLRRTGIDAHAFHGKLSQGTRSSSLAWFKDSTITVLVATDLAARGIDIVDLPVVLNYDLPRSPGDYIHRIGRTGRAGKSGTAISFVTADSHAHFCLIEKRQNQTIPREDIPGFEATEAPPKPSSESGGIKGRRKSKKDKLREAAAKKERNPRSGDQS